LSVRQRTQGPGPAWTRARRSGPRQHLSARPGSVPQDQQLA